MLYTLLSINLDDNKQLGLIVIVIVVVVVLAAILMVNISIANDKRKEKNADELDSERQGEHLVKRVEAFSKQSPKEKKIQQVKTKGIA